MKKQRSVNQIAFDLLTSQLTGLYSLKTLDYICFGIELLRMETI
jgi:hypothetical protein